MTHLARSIALRSHAAPPRRSNFARWASEHRTGGIVALRAFPGDMGGRPMRAERATSSATSAGLSVSRGARGSFMSDNRQKVNARERPASGLHVGQGCEVLEAAEVVPAKREAVGANAPCVTVAHQGVFDAARLGGDVLLAADDGDLHFASPVAPKHSGHGSYCNALTVALQGLFASPNVKFGRAA